VLALVRAFLNAGLMAETGRLERTVTGTPQGGIASPLLATSPSRRSTATTRRTGTR
jgi:hypothetical protein